MTRLCKTSHGAYWLALALPVLFLGLGACEPAGDVAEFSPAADSAEEGERPMGLLLNEGDVAPGYVLYSPLSSGRTFLLDTDAQVVHSWDSDYRPCSVYLLADGRLLRPGRDPDAVGFQAGGAMGLLEMYTWEGERIWQWKLSDDRQILHQGGIQDALVDGGDHFDAVLTPQRFEDISLGH